MTFKELGLIEPILKALAEQGYEKPSPIQEKAIPPPWRAGTSWAAPRPARARPAPSPPPFSRSSAPARARGGPSAPLILTPHP